MIFYGSDFKVPSFVTIVRKLYALSNVKFPDPKYGCVKKEREIWAMKPYFFPNYDFLGSVQKKMGKKWYVLVLNWKETFA